MSIFKSILAKIFPSGHPANSAAPQTSAPATGTSAQASASGSAPGSASGSAPASAPGSAPGSTSGSAQAPTPASAAAPSPAASSGQTVDVEAVLSDMQSKHQEKLNWKTSIVDLLKLLGLDSSLAARKQLAGELHYSGNTDDSAAMNIWLHKEVMRKLGENGGKLPDDLTN